MLRYFDAHQVGELQERLNRDTAEVARMAIAQPKAVLSCLTRIVTNTLVLFSISPKVRRPLHSRPFHALAALGGSSLDMKIEMRPCSLPAERWACQCRLRFALVSTLCGQHGDRIAKLGG